MEELHKGLKIMHMKRKGVHVSCVYTCDICGPGSEFEAHLHTFGGVTCLWFLFYVLKFHDMSGITLVVCMVIVQIVGLKT
jgi:hypothetical protein